MTGSTPPTLRAWGFDGDTFAADDLPTLELAARETLILNQVPVPGLDCEIVDEGPTQGPAAEEAVALLRRLCEWEQTMGGWDNPVWRDAERFLGLARAEPDIESVREQVASYAENLVAIGDLAALDAVFGTDDAHFKLSEYTDEQVREIFQEYIQTEDHDDD